MVGFGIVCRQPVQHPLRRALVLPGLSHHNDLRASSGPPVPARRHFAARRGVQTSLDHPGKRNSDRAGLPRHLGIHPGRSRYASRLAG